MLIIPSLNHAIAAFLLTVASVAAQQDTVASMAVNPGVLTQGSSATIRYSNPALAGHTIVVDIDNGMRRNKQTATIEITLDANGKGSAVWTVPSWFGANFNAPGVTEVNCPVVR